MVYQVLTEEINAKVFEAIKGPDHEPQCIRDLVTGNIETSAGIGSQYFSTLVFALIYTLIEGEQLLYHMIDLVGNRKLPLSEVKIVMNSFFNYGFDSMNFTSYVLLNPDVDRFAKEIMAHLDEVEDPDDLLAVLSALFSYMNMMHSWLHLRFPWGLGCAFKKKLGQMPDIHRA